MSTTTDYAPPVDAPVSAVVPVCLLGDTSSSMAAGPGPVSPIAALNAGLSSLISTLQIHPEAADTAVVEIIEFSSTASVVMPYTHVDAAATPPVLSANGSTGYGEAFALARRGLEALVAAHRSTLVYRPTVYMITDGGPTDTGWESELDTLCSLPFAPNICVFGVAGADEAVLRRIARRDRGMVWLADEGTDPAQAFAALFPALVRTVLNSASAAAAGAPVPAPIPTNVPGMTQLDVVSGAQ
ncbi:MULTISPECIES: vWA domain-containing protein [Microbacterium]|jgi:uncharacterized protein YegL|uniref:VWFA domain-containing protein n=1 Tax=Microbacterium mcarthurae TaxID=3035918 RepID=A0ABW9GFP5_9MICO|nr:hypothetical protein [Microbacterium sp. ACRRU]MCG7418667.1 hypothetical protein [Microbacterium sp. ACRRU]